MFLRNADAYSQVYTALLSRRPTSIALTFIKCISSISDVNEHIFMGLHYHIDLIYQTLLSVGQ
jgi:hypothetical protein